MILNNQDKPKSGHGGPRPGSGRKSIEVEKLWVRFAEDVLSSVDAKKIAIGLLKHKDVRVKADTLRYFLDRILGKPAQALTVAGDSQKPLEVIIRFIGQSHAGR